MKYVITGSLGHISKPVVEHLVNKGHAVTVITSKPANAVAIEALGATAAVGSVEDRAFLTSSFVGADAVYLMIPPNWAATDWLAYQQQVADNYIAAIQANGVRKVVQLSSIGAHLRKGAGPIDGLGYLEAELEELSGTDVKVLRPSYFYYNLFSMIPLIKGMGITGGNFGGTDEKLVLVHTRDIANVVAEALDGLAFTGYSIQYIASDERHPREIAAVLGNAIGKPDLPWIVFSDEQTLQGMLQSGLSATIAEGYTALGASIQNGHIQADYWQNPPAQKGAVTLEDFAQEFAGAYQAS
jgi:uncharacterized protein YbjT (DUF2867 family)